VLFIVATPIGHLGDFSQRAIQTLLECDAILCEDTRRSSILLQNYKIQKPLISYHQFKEVSSLEKILNELNQGKKLALISDAGTPCINDPGQKLISACIEQKIPFTAIPGPCSVIQALVLSGFDTDRFQFVGFLPKSGEKTLRQILCYPGTTVAFESPSRLIGTLEEVQKLDNSRQIAVAREMTKSFEECVRGTAKELLAYFQQKTVRGEIVMIFSKGCLDEEDLSLEELVQMLQDFHGLSLKEAIKQAARFKDLPKSVVYKKFHR
jgi:16S rRNA (cytidine1402-2'-O)-methyltransferase